MSLSGIFDPVVRAYFDGHGGGAGNREPVEEKDVNFYDYDGTLLYAYTIAEAQALTELPPLPTQPGLICQGWNWTLDDIRTIPDFVDVGATYITDDGSTRFYIDILSEQGLARTLELKQSIENGIEVDWGDGSATETVSGTGAVFFTHTYANTGRFVISALPSESCAMLLGHGTHNVFGETTTKKALTHKIEVGRNVAVLGTSCCRDINTLGSVSIPVGVTSIESTAFTFSDSLSAVIIPKGCTGLSTNCFGGSSSLRVVSIPSSVSGFWGSSHFVQCFALKKMAFPDSVAYLGNSAIQGDKSLERVHLPKSITAVKGSLLSGCHSLMVLTVPENVTSIEAQAFYSCENLLKLRFLPKTPPAVANSNAFTGIPTDCVVEVPMESLEAYKNATNYGGIAAQMVGV